jgi:Homeodomain-like domain
MAESTEGLWMTAKERDQLEVLHEVKQRHLTQKQAATELGISARWVRKLLVRLRARGDGALRHGLRVQFERRLDGSRWTHWRNRTVPPECCETSARGNVKRAVQPRVTAERSAEEEARARRRQLDSRRRLSQAYAHLRNRPI